MNEPHKNSANYHNLNKYLDPRLTDSLNQSGLRLNLDIDFGNQTIDIAGQLALELSAKEEHEATVTAEDLANLSRIPHDYGQPEKQQSADEAMEIQQENMGCAGEEPAKVKTPKPQKPNSVADTDLGRRKTIAAALNPLAPPSLGFLCQHCPKSFTTSRGLIAHNARIHRFLCPHCPKTYRISRSMKGHIAQMHKAQQEHKETRQQQPRAAVHIHANAPQALPLAAQGPSVSVTSAAADPATYCELCHKQCRSANGFKLHQKGWEHVKKALAAV